MADFATEKEYFEQEERLRMLDPARTAARLVDLSFGLGIDPILDEDGNIQPEFNEADSEMDEAAQYIRDQVRTVFTGATYIPEEAIHELADIFEIPQLAQAITAGNIPALEQFADRLKRRGLEEEALIVDILVTQRKNFERVQDTTSS